MTATVNGNAVTFNEAKWLAAQGNKEAQVILSECLSLSEDERGFWEYKSVGGKAFTVEAWKSELSGDA